MGLLRPTPSSNQDSQQFHFLLGNTQIGRSVQSQQNRLNPHRISCPFWIELLC